MSAAVGDFSHTTIGRFHVRRLIARGGMGEVYFATDPLLGRDLAIKVLRQDVTRDPERVARFVQEARAASALNHPHVISIYDIGEATPLLNGAEVGPPLHYIAMELVAGETLRAAIDAHRVQLEWMLDYFAQVADALAAAHASGVVHRDLKPENLMIAADGYAKVLDFGLAKLRDEVSQAGTTPLGPDLTQSTTAGMLVGTVGYMSPEQAQSLAVDRRADVFAFGCVLYEAIAGARAFDGPHALAILKKIVHDDPPSIDRAAVPDDLRRIVWRCLAKRPDDRYQSMRDAAADLRALRRKLEAAAHVDAPLPFDYAQGGPAPRRGPVTAIVAAAAAVLAIAGAAWWLVSRDGRHTEPAHVTIDRLTASGTAIDAAISPDGRWLAWVESVAGMQSIRIKQVAEDRSRELVPAAVVGYWGMAFTRDGSQLYFARKSATEPGGRLFSVATAGGPPRTILDGIDSTVAFSPDGGRIAFYRASHPERGASSLVTADRDGGNLRVLATLRAPELFVPAFFAAPSWSPDGGRIAVAVHNAQNGDARVALADAVSGELTPFARRFTDASFTAWLPDGSGILFVATQSDAFREFPRKVWMQPYPRGEPRRVTPDLLEYRNLSVRADGRAFVSVGLDAVYTLWNLPLDGRPPRRLTSERYDGLLGIAPLPDGRIVVSIGERGNPQLALLGRDGTDRTVLTREGTNLWPAASPDGRTIAFVSNRDGRTGIWKMNADGADPRLLAHLPRPSWLSISPDGRFVVCASASDVEPSTWRIPLDGAEAPLRVASGLDRPAVSPDGRLLAGINVPPSGGPLTLVVMPLDGGEAPRVLGPIAPATANGILEWTADGRGILFSTVERSNVWLQPVAGGAPAKITNLADLGIVRGRRTADGHSLIVARGVAQTDAYLVSNFR